MQGLRSTEGRSRDRRPSPRQAPMKCLVVGGGVVGASIAWQLAKRGVGEVLLLERDRLGSGTTWHSAGNITWKASRDHDAPILFALETVARLKEEAGQETGWLRTGRL